MKAIFLDFDGVLTTLSSHWRIIPEKYILLGKILAKTNAKIVISSSWRRDNLENTLEFITNCDINYYLANNPFPFCDKIVGQTKKLSYEERYSYHDKRGVYIQNYLKEHPEITNYVIIDDENDMLEEQQSHFVWTNFDIGLTDEEVNEAIRILNDKGES